LALYVISEIFLSLGIGITLYAQPFLYKSGGLSDAQIGVLFAVNSSTAGVCAFLLGSVADRLGATRVVKFATLAIALGYLLTASAWSASLWYATAVLTGLGGALLMTTENVVLSALTKEREKARLLSRFVALYTFVMAVGTMVAGELCTIGSYRTTMFVGAGIALVAPAIRFFVHAEDVKSERLFKLPSRRLVAMCGYAMVFGVGLGLFNPFATLILKANFGLGDSVIGPISAVSMFMVSLGAFAVSPLLQRLRHQRTLFLSFVLSTAVTVALGFCGNPYGFAALYLLRTALTSIPGSIVDAEFLNLTSPTEYAQMFGVRVFGNNVGNALGSTGGGALLSSHQGVWIYIGSAAALVLAYLYLVFLMARLRGRSAET
jgi:MFS family permease